ncbi:MAG TPA: hypothetical protein VFK85_01760 [Anaeromyxobacteraceae bacterium]|nr:hypothetical protein [Anaeromyxobacteraceae bacterium]
MPGPRHVLLVPGFFGFANLGDFAYFGHVHDLLRATGPEAGIDGDVRVVTTIPTASLPTRAARVAEAITELVAQRGGVVSIVGHSSGGLDARLAVAPGATLPTSVDVEAAAQRVESVVTVSTPHHGTPVAHLFNSVFGQQLLRLLSLSTIYVLRAGRLPLGVVLRLAGWFARPGAPPSGVLDQLFQQLLSDFSLERRRAVERFFQGVGGDQNLLPQITPAGTDVFNASIGDRPGVRYASVVGRARPPGLRSTLAAGLDPYAQATHALYMALYRLASRTPRGRAPPLNPEQRKVLYRAYRLPTDHRANDGMVPTLSQVRGDVLAAVWADHLDIIGHFHHPTHVPPHVDWLTSGTRFDRQDFESVWRKVAAFVGGRAATVSGAPAGRRPAARM